MKTRWLAIGLVSLLAGGAHAAIEGTVKIYDAPGLGTTGGGAFIAKVTSSTSPGNVFQAGDSFLTFCLEEGETINYGTPTANNYSFDLDTKAINGGGGPNPDPISRATAWLYYHFRVGDLASQAGAGAFAMDNAGGNALQKAIWYLENEPSGSANYLVAAAQTALGATYLNAANGEFAVYVMNLYTLNTDGSVRTYNQSMLAIVPEPSTYLAAALLLLPFGASAARILRKNRSI